MHEPVATFDTSRAPGAAGDFFAAFDRLREEHRWFWNDWAQGYWVLTRAEDIREAFHAPEIFSNHSIVPSDPDPQYRFLPSYTDPPIHRHYRKALNRWFSLAAVERIEPELRRLAVSLVDDVADTGACDFLPAFAEQYPARAVATVMGLSTDTVPFLLDCAHRISGGVSSPGDRSGPVSAMEDIKAFYADVVEDRRADPRDPETDLVASLLQATIEGRPLDDDELLDICMTLTFGGIDTTARALAWSMWHLATNDDDRRWIVEDPVVVPSAVEEFLRAFPIVSMARKVTEDTDFHGCPMKKGDMVLLAIQTATRDPDVVDAPTEIRLDRSPNRHIAFGASEHRCIGSHLARAELRIALEEWHRRIPRYQLARDAGIPCRGTHLSELPLVWDPPRVRS